MFGIRTRLNRLRLDRAAISDARRLRAAHPELVPSETHWEIIQAGLSTPYRIYVSTVSTPGMAVSLPTAIYLYHLCCATRPASVLDLGSGFSSYVLRRYARFEDQSVTTTSVDDDDEWLTRTADFLRQHDSEADGLRVWSEYQASAEVLKHDLVFHDLASGELREATMAFAIQQLSPRGVVVFDDAQHLGVRERMHAEAARVGLELFSLRMRTLDELGRWAVLGVKP